MIPSDVVETFPALRRQGLRSDRGHAGRRAAEYPERDPGRVQFAARDAAGVQLSRRLLESSFETRCFASLLRTRFRVSDRAHFPRPEEPAKRASRRTARARSWVRPRAAAARRPRGDLDRIKAGVIRCGGVPRPGLLGQSPDGREASGLYLDLCRAIGAALLGPERRIEFHPYDSDTAFDAGRERRATTFPSSTGRTSSIMRLAGKRRSARPSSSCRRRRWSAATRRSSA